MQNYGTVLNIAAGKLSPIDQMFEKSFSVNVDRMYNNAISESVIDIECWYNTFLKNHALSMDYKCNDDIFHFLFKTIMNFDQVCIYRFLEHVHRDRILEFIYGISSVTRNGAVIDVIVPNYEILANMLLNETISQEVNFEKHNILLTTELLNEPDEPHCSIWTEDRLKYYWELEERFRIISIEPQYKFDGRDIYLRMVAERV